ncbi:MAG: Re/Si-specific NAD(P)(+) transhydrogenase subunit alpha [Planctomycetota bacterium]|nr:Re/Si-specific NAD(P)(+) transhydrogenase subunit alpha [Planctomycetota bacterium]
MRLSVPKELAAGERRVALVPETVKKLTAAGFSVVVEHDAGTAANFLDQQYLEAGATIERDANALFSKADMVVKVGPPLTGPGVARDEIAMMREGAMALASMMPTRNLAAVQAMKVKKITSFSTDTIPRTTRAQAMDTLSAMANIVGYKAALMAALEMPRYTPMLTTAAGTILPAKFFVIGAGVAGLQAIATARRIGAAVSATDVRPEVKEQIESVGAKYVGIQLKADANAGGGYAKELSEDDKARQRELLAEQCSISAAVITTALIRGVTAPKLITADIVKRMKPGAVIIDLAADGGGNCELSRPGETVVEHGVKIVAPLNLPATMPTDASLLWSRNLMNFLLAFWKDKAFSLDLNDEIMRGAVITHQGDIVHPWVKEAAASAAR